MLFWLGHLARILTSKYAMVLGMIPDCLLANVRAAGNSAGAGARMALLNQAARRDIEVVVRQIEKIETAVQPSFQDHFVKAMAIPAVRSLCQSGGGS